MEIKKYGDRNWAVYDSSGQLVCLTVYKKGALEVTKRLSEEGGEVCSASSIDLQEFAKLHMEFRQLSKKFNKIIKDIKSRNMINKAVL